jgi:hypothetical protein
LERRLAQQGPGATEVAELRRRLADAEARVAVTQPPATAVAPAAGDVLESRVMHLEALLHEAAKSRDEANILRTKIAELDGRLGQTMKALSEARAQSEQV